MRGGARRPHARRTLCTLSVRLRARPRGAHLIDMGIGDPALPTPPHVVEALKRGAENPEHPRYPSYEGMIEFRTAAADWYRRRFGVGLDPETEVLALVGSKEGTAHMPLAFVNPGDVVLVPDPGYPVYAGGTWFAGGEVPFMPLLRKNGFMPDLDAVPPDLARRAKLMYLNYPNNPTAGTATREFFARAVDFALTHGLLRGHRPRRGGARQGQDQRGLGRVPGDPGGGHRRAQRAPGRGGAVPAHLPGAARRRGRGAAGAGLGGGHPAGRVLRVGAHAGRPRLTELRRAPPGGGALVG